MIKAYNLETRELIGEYKTMKEVAEAFDLTLACVKGYFNRYKIFGKARIKNHYTDTWCYLEKPETKRMPNYKERCLKAIELLKRYGNGSFDEKLLEILGADNEEYYI